MEALIELFKDVWEYARLRKKYWLLALIVTLILIGIIIIYPEGSALAPLIYTIF